MADEKQRLRDVILARLNAMDSVERLEKSSRILERVLQSGLFTRASVVLVYDSSKTEVDTSRVLDACLAAGKTLCLPRTVKRDCALTPHRVADLQNDLEPCRLGFREPFAKLPREPLERIDLVVVPGVAFDTCGNRLGRGKGYYDRLLALPEFRARTVAFAFECQLVDTVPHEAHDRGVETLITEDRVIDCR
jgi:5-formyltetrahydrofolate cyclo-ligase